MNQKFKIGQKVRAIAERKELDGGLFKIDHDGVIHSAHGRFNEKSELIGVRYFVAIKDIVIQRYGTEKEDRLFGFNENELIPL